MDEQQRDFKGIWLPKEIWLNEDLTMYEKVILMEIDSLDSSEDGCYAKNNHFAKLCNCTETTVSTSISKLQKIGLIEIIKFDGRKRYIKSRLKDIYRQPLNNLKADFKSFKSSIYNNTNNNTNNNINNNINEPKTFKKPTVEDIQTYCIERNNNIDAEQFYDFYESKGWLVGKNKMKDWKAAVRTWEKRNKPRENIRQSNREFLERKRKEIMEEMNE